MKTAIPFAMLAGPAMAHGGIHAHPHGAEDWIVLTVLLVIAAGCLVLVRGRR